jgi:hypothetical protein
VKVIRYWTLLAKGEYLFKKGRRWRTFTVGIAFFGVIMEGFVGLGKAGKLWTFGNEYSLYNKCICVGVLGEDLDSM